MPFEATTNAKGKGLATDQRLRILQSYKKKLLALPSPPVHFRNSAIKIRVIAKECDVSPRRAWVECSYQDPKTGEWHPSDLERVNKTIGRLGSANGGMARGGETTEMMLPEPAIVSKYIPARFRYVYAEVPRKLYSVFMQNTWAHKCRAGFGKSVVKKLKAQINADDRSLLRLEGVTILADEQEAHAILEQVSITKIDPAQTAIPLRETIRLPRKMIRNPIFNTDDLELRKLSEDQLRRTYVCPMCRKPLKKGSYTSLQLGRAIWICTNKFCISYDPRRGYGSRFAENEMLGSNPNAKRLSNTENRKNCYDIFYMRRVEKKTLTQTQYAYHKLHGAWLPKTTICDIENRVGDELHGDFVGCKFIVYALSVGFLGFQYGSEKYFYMIVDTTPYQFRDRLTRDHFQLWLYLCLDYGTNGTSVLEWEMSPSRDPTITESMLEKAYEAGYHPDVIVADRGTDVRPGIDDFIENHKEEHIIVYAADRLHKKWTIREKLDPHKSKRRTDIEHDDLQTAVVDSELRRFRKSYSNRLVSVLDAAESGFERELARLKEDEYEWSKDEEVRKQVQSLIDEAELFRAPFRHKGCPGDTESINYVCSMIDKNKKRAEIGKSPQKWSHQAIQFLGLYNKELLERSIVKQRDS